MKRLRASYRVQQLTNSMLKGIWIWFLLLLAGAAQAQIVPDRTLGSERSRLAPRSPGVDQIEGGAVRGANLFHSFSEFNVGDRQRIDFANPTGIQNIFSRVTGTNASNINGTLGVAGSANLFLLNPNGILFGPNAQLDLRGSFLGTTANAISFGTQGSFSATNPTAPQLLTIQPSALLFSQGQGGSGALQSPGAIVAQDALLGVSTGQSLLLVGGDVTMRGGVLGATDGRVELGGLSAPGSITLTQTGGIWSLGFLEGIERSNVSFNTNSTPLGISGIGVAGNGNGSITITAKTFEISGSKPIGIFAGIDSAKGGRGVRGGDITIDATNSVLLSQVSAIVNRVLENGIGDGGNIVITTGTLQVQDSSFITNYHQGQGNGGDILITARDSVTVRGGKEIINTLNGSFLSSSINTGGIRGTGNSGRIQITTGSLFLKEGGSLRSNSNRLGNSGDITINARDRVILDGSTPARFDGGPQDVSTITTALFPDAIGNGGNIVINAGTFSATNGGTLASGIQGRGSGGNISINARDSVTFSGGVKTAVDRISTSSATSAVLSGSGNGGNIEITTGSLFLTAGGNLQAGTAGRGNSGNILISARDRVEVDGETSDTVTSEGVTFKLSSNIFGAVVGDTFDLKNIGNGGEIRIETGSLSVTNGGYITSDTIGRGNAGNISIDARDSILVDGDEASTIISSRVLGGVLPNGTRFRGTGKGGNLTLNARQITVSNGGYVSSSTFGDGNAGSLFINARDSITIQGASRLTGYPSGLYSDTYPGSNGESGTLQVRTGTLSMLSGGVLASSNRGSGNAGAIDIQANIVQLKDGSEIRSLTTSGNGGNLFLTANDVLLMRRSSSITASATATANSGNSGNMTIDAGQIVAPLKENNTIAANATKGNGGRVVINTQGLYGIEARSTAISGLSGITATSEQGVQGNVAIAQPNVQPTQGTLELPSTTIDASNQVAQVCPRNPDVAKVGKFTVSGPGSLPPNPLDPLAAKETAIPLATSDAAPNQSIAQIPKPASSQLIEAQGWVKSPDGKVSLVARTPEVTPPVVAACR